MPEDPQHIEEQVPEPSTIEAMAETARGLVSKVRTLALATIISALWLWGVFYYPFTAFEQVGAAMSAVLVGALMLLPGGVLLLFSGGLRELMHLPQRIKEMGVSGRKELRSAADRAQGVRETPSRSWRIARLFQAIWSLRRTIIRYKATLIKYAAAIRLFTLPALFLVFLALIVGVVLIVVAVLSIPVVLIVLLVG